MFSKSVYSRDLCKNYKLVHQLKCYKVVVHLNTAIFHLPNLPECTFLVLKYISGKLI